MKSILLLTVRMGSGHFNAASSVKEALEYLYPKQFKITLVDLFDLFQFIGPALNKAAQQFLYHSSEYAPRINQFIFSSTNREWRVKLLNILNSPLLAGRMEALIQKTSPDLIVSTFSVWDYLIRKIAKKSRRQPLLINIITDSIRVHASWTCAKPDYHIVANADTARSLKKLKIPAEKIKVLGFPIALKFLGKAPLGQCKKVYQLDRKKKTLLYLATDDRVPVILKSIHQLMPLADYQMVIVTGRDAKKIPAIRKKIPDPRVHLLGWTDKLHDLMRISDVIVTKAGGSTVMEAIACQKPLIITKILAEQEAGNAEFIVKHKLGAVLSPKNPDLPRAIRFIEKNQKEIRKNLKKFSNSRASLKIARFIRHCLS